MAIFKFLERGRLLEDGGLLGAWTLDLSFGILLDLVDWLAAELRHRHLLLV